MYKIVLCICALYLLSSCSNLKLENLGLKESNADSNLRSPGSVEQNTQEQEVPKHELVLYKNSHVLKWIDYFTKKDINRFKSFLNRGSYYQEVMQTLLEEEELPHTLYYLPLIESGFNNVAKSHAGAVGPWQFIRGTAKRYGLDINRFVDERRDPILSTEAATKYLTDLYNVFNSWELAIAAYNCGEIRVLRAIMKGKTRDFWELSKRKLLPRETRNYVPKFLAAAYIGENLEEFGINLDKKDVYPDVELYEIPGGVKMSTLAKHLDIDFIKLKKINPSLKRNITPGWLKKHSVWLPPKYLEKLKVVMPKLVANRSWNKIDSSPKVYRVRRGDSLGRISRKFKISVNRLKRMNGLTSNKILVGQRLDLRVKKYKKISGKRFYFVKRRDILGKIAKRFGVSVGYLRKLNGLHSNRIYLGQKLDVTSGVSDFRYRVKRGDNLHLIAKLYRTTIYNIKRKNRLSSNRIYAGQLLRI